MFIPKITPYLIQRCVFDYKEKDRNESGIDNILTFCYMGSSEYEWGALPKSLKEIRNRFNDYIYFDLVVHDKVITVFCKSIYKEVIEQVILDLSENKYRLKERCYFHNFINDDTYEYFKADCWWDIENHFFFWRKDDEFEMKFKELIRPNNK